MNKVISLMGPTASGKTDLAILLANKFDIEINIKPNHNYAGFKTNTF